MTTRSRYISLWIDGHQIDGVVAMEYFSSRDNPIDVMQVEVAGIFTEPPTSLVGLPAQVTAGYREEPASVKPRLIGQVADVERLSSGMVFKLKDHGLRLQQTIKKTWLQHTASQIIADIAAMVGFDQVDAAATSQKRRVFVVPEMTGLEAVRLVNESFGLDYDCFVKDGSLVWQPWTAPAADSLVFEHGENIVGLEYYQEDNGKLTTFFLPDLEHGSRIRIIDHSKGLDFHARVDQIHCFLGEKNEEHIYWTRL